MNRARVFYDRDQFEGSMATADALYVLRNVGIEALAFDWTQRFSSPQRGERVIPSEIGDPCDFSVEQLRWMREKGLL